MWNGSVKVVVATYKAATWITACLESLVPVEDHVIVVDNDSPDNTCSLIRTLFPRVTLLRLKENVGFAAANNLGIAQAIRSGARYVFLLNQDAIAAPATVDLLCSLAEQYPDYGFIGPIRLNYEGTNLETNCRKAMVLHQHGERSYVSDLVMGRKPECIYEVRFWAAAAALMPTQVLRQVGGFDPAFFMYGEDGDLCWRIRRRGYKVGFTPLAVVRHRDQNCASPRGQKWKSESRLWWRLRDSRWARCLGMMAAFGIWAKSDMLNWVYRLKTWWGLVCSYQERKRRRWAFDLERLLTDESAYKEYSVSG